MTTTDSRLSKVPAVTLSFWILKILSTGLGEATSDYLVKAIGQFVAVPLAGVVMCVVFYFQFSAPDYRPLRYWSVVLAISVFGTMVADVMHKGLGIPFTISTSICLVGVLAIFFLWHRVEGTLSMPAIDRPRRELFYWATVMATFALGTAAGDLTARGLHVGFLGSVWLFLGLFALPSLWFASTRRGPIASLWVAYVLTRPVGASVADYMAVDHRLGGLQWGWGVAALWWIVAFVLAAAIVAVRNQRA
jgi:uncharacterized membrane-anchored protein